MPPLKPRPSTRGKSATCTTAVENDGGAVLGTYRDPFGATPVLVVALPIDRVEPTPYQRDPSETHIKKLMTVIEKVGRFLDPLVLIRQDDALLDAERQPSSAGHEEARCAAASSACSCPILKLPSRSSRSTPRRRTTSRRNRSRRFAWRARSPARKQGKETDFAFEFEQAQFLTLGAAYEQRKSLSGGAYTSVLRRIDDFLDEPMPKALKERERRGNKVLALDDAVAKIVEALKAKGLTSPYLKAFVVARINPIRFSKATEFDFDEVIDKMTASAKKFNVEKVKQEDVAKAGGGGAPADDE